jgi:hypothetical protein
MSEKFGSATILVAIILLAAGATAGIFLCDDELKQYWSKVE